VNARAYFAKLGRAAWVPWVFRWCARVEQVAWDEVAGDPSAAAYVLRSGQQLLGTDAVLSWFDTALEAESCGARVERDSSGVPLRVEPPAGPLPGPEEAVQRSPLRVAVEVAARLAAEMRGRTPVVGYLTGPATLARWLAGSQAGDHVDYARALLAAVARRYCDAGVGALLVAEEEWGDRDRVRPGLQDVANLAAYYDVPVWVLGRITPPPDVQAELHGLGLATIPGDPFAVVPVTELGAATLSHFPALGSGTVVTTSWEVPPDAPPESLLRLAQALNP